jgi:hypothetical protein
MLAANNNYPSLLQKLINTPLPFKALPHLAFGGFCRVFGNAPLSKDLVLWAVITQGARFISFYFLLFLDKKKQKSRKKITASFIYYTFTHVARFFSQLA